MTATCIIAFQQKSIHTFTRDTIVIEATVTIVMIKLCTGSDKVLYNNSNSNSNSNNNNTNTNNSNNNNYFNNSDNTNAILHDHDVK